MKKLAILLFTIPVFGISQVAWTKMQNIPNTLGSPSGFGIGQYGYIGLGWNPGVNKFFYRYDTITSSWSSVFNTFPGAAVAYTENFTVNGKGYLACGQGTASATVLNEVWEYSPSTNSWLQRSNYIGGGRTEAAAFSIGSKGYVGLGTAAPGLKSDFYEFDPLSNTWTQKSSCGIGPDWGAVGFSIGSKGYFALGVDSTNNTTKALWEYNPITNIWIQKANFPGIGRIRAVAFSINGKGYVGAGNDYYNAISLFDFYEYNPVSDSWLAIPSLSVIPRQDAIAFSVGNNGYVGAGADQGSPYYNDFWRLKINSGIGIEENNVFNESAFFPNPSVNEIKIKTDLKAGDKGKLEIRDITGRKLYEAELNSETKVDVSNFANGTYIANIFVNGTLFKTKKFIVLK